MQKATDAAKLLFKQPEKNHLEHLKEINLFECFESIFKLDTTIRNANLICAFLIYAYDPDSLKLDIRKDRRENKVDILLSLGLSEDDEIISEILLNESDVFNDCVLLFLEKLTDWRWYTIFSLLDYHSNMMRFANQKTEEEKSFDKINKEGNVKTLTQSYDIDVVSKVNIQKSEVFKKGIEAREKADKLLDDIRKDFVSTDNAVQQDLGFQFTETAKKKVDIMSWRSYVREINEKKKTISV